MLYLDHPDPEGAAAADALFQFPPTGSGEFLGIVEPGRSRLAQQHGGRHNGPSQRPAAGLVNTDDEFARGQRGSKFARGSSG